MGHIMNTYLCCYCDRWFQAPVGSIDRTTEVRCPDCTDPDELEHRLRWMAG